MKHGDKAKAKSAKAKASGKKDAGKGGREAKARESSKAAGKKEGSAAKALEKGSSAAKALEKGSSAAAKTSGNGKPSLPPRRAAAAQDADGFSNPTVAGAFKRAIKKYPTAFRRLTD